MAPSRALLVPNGCLPTQVIHRTRRGRDDHPLDGPSPSYPEAGFLPEHIEPLKWGGWGYRVIPGRSALILRAGPGLVLDLRNGRRFAVTVDDPEIPAGVLTEIRRAGG